jgi:hypothetical protein
MEPKTSLLEPLFEKAETFGKTNLELIKLKSIDKTATLSANAVSRLLFLSVVVIFAITVNIALALWVGDLLGKNYYGFLAVAALYAVLGIVLFFSHSSIKSRVYNSVLTQLLN